MIITNNELPYQFILINMFNICLSVFKLDKYDTANEKKKSSWWWEDILGRDKSQTCWQQLREWYASLKWGIRNHVKVFREERRVVWEEFAHILQLLCLFLLLPLMWPRTGSHKYHKLPPQKEDIQHLLHHIAGGKQGYSRLLTHTHPCAFTA